jgi:small GTP-binding protein
MRNITSSMEREYTAEGTARRAAAGNRAARLTPPGATAIAVVRIDGPGVTTFLARHFSRPARLGRCVHGSLTDGPRTIDDPVVVLADGGRAADINLHGGEWVVRECLELARREGFEIVEGVGELLDADDEIEREMIEALPAARTEQAVRILLAQPAHWNALTADAGRQLRAADVQAIRQDRGLWWMLNPPTVAIVGIPNVGKSTIANCLFGQVRSITADVPGTTRDWVGDWANLDGLPVHLLDTPGQRHSSDAIEQAAIAASQAEIERADLVIVVLDPTQPPAPDQAAIRARYPDSMTVINKTDLHSAWDAGSIDAIRLIASTGGGIDELRLAIRKRFHCLDMSTERGRWWTQRQRELLQSWLVRR